MIKKSKKTYKKPCDTRIPIIFVSAKMVAD